MPSYNNGSVRANVQAGNTSGPYIYTLFVDVNGSWVQFDTSTITNFDNSWSNPSPSTSALTYVFGNQAEDPNQNTDGTQGLPAGTYKVEVSSVNDPSCGVVDGTGTVDDYTDGGDPEFTCTDAGFTMQATTTGQIGQPSINFASVSQGTLQSVSPSTIQSGGATYTASILIPSGFIGAGVATLDTCQDDSIGLVGGGNDFSCSDTTITIPNGTVGQNVTATSTVGIVGAITPAQYVNGTTTYSVEITAPASYDNAGTVLNCSATGTATSGGGTNDSIYLLHGGSVSSVELPYVSDITTATTYYVNAAFDTDSTANALTNAMGYIFDNQGSQYVPDLVEIPNITAINSTQIPDGTINFPATSNGESARFYMIVNQNIATDLTSVQAFADVNNGVAVAFASRKAFSWNGADWWIYNTGANGVGGTVSYNCVIS